MSACIETNLLNGAPTTYAELAEAYSILRSGGLILVKGDIGYGFLGHSEESMRRMFELKGRSTSNPAIVIGSLRVLQEITTPIPNTILAWLNRAAERTTLAAVYWLRRSSPFWTGLPQWVQQHTSKDGTVATFLNTGSFVERLVSLAATDQFLIVGSSANFSSTGNNYRFEAIPDRILQGVDLALNHGRAKYENDSKLATTIVDLTTLQIRRRGVNADFLESSLQLIRSANDIP
jgi:tRNA A37 threonylcarbamoyladenosine synthetase subunit TsaC/SUA5/YrdC